MAADRTGRADRSDRTDQADLTDRADRTDRVAARLRVDPRLLATVLGVGWRVADGHAGEVPADPGGARGRVYVGVPSPGELRALDLPPDGLRHFGLGPADLRRGGWTDADLRSAGLTPPGAGPVPVAWFVAGDPPQLMLGIPGEGPPSLARPEPRWDGHDPVLDPVDAVEVPALVGCTDPDGDDARAVRELRDALLRRARRRLVHCAVCLRQVHRASTTHGACHPCTETWLGILH